MIRGGQDAAAREIPIFSCSNAIDRQVGEIENALENLVQHLVPVARPANTGVPAQASQPEPLRSPLQSQ